MIFKILSYLPWWLTYAIAEFLGFFAFNLFRYRSGVIIKNLKSCFPEKSDLEVGKLYIKFSRQFAQVLSEIIFAYHFTEKDWKKRVSVKNAEPVLDYINKGQSVLMVYGHMNNWEWPLLSLGPILNIKTEFLYKPLEKDSVDSVLLEFREKHGGKGLPKDKAIRHILKHKDEARAIGIIADQVPSKGTEKQWHNFFNRETAFYQGPEKIAIATQSPVFFLEVLRASRGRYQCTFHEIAAPPYARDHSGIIEAYANMLEENIRKQPEGYLWSHRRWKYTKEQDLA